MHAPVDMALSGFDFVIVLCMGQHGVTCSGLAVCVHHYSDTNFTNFCQSVEPIKEYTHHFSINTCCTHTKVQQFTCIIHLLYIISVMHMHGKDRMVTFDPGDVGAAGLSNFSFALY